MYINHYGNNCRDGERLLHRVFNANRIVFAIFVVATVFATGLPLKADNASLRIVNVSGKGGGGYTWGWLLQRANSDVGNLRAKLSQPFRVFGENISIDDTSPNEKPALPYPSCLQNGLWDSDARSIIGFWPDNCLKFFWQHWKSVAFWQIGGPRLSVMLHDGCLGWRASAITPNHIQLISVPVPVAVVQSRAESWAREAQKCSLGRFCGFIGAVGNLIQVVGKQGEEAGKDSRPDGWLAEYVLDPLPHILFFALVVVSVFLSIAVLLCVWRSIEFKEFGPALLAVWLLVLWLVVAGQTYTLLRKW
jgi:hypothetical protein